MGNCSWLSIGLLVIMTFKTLSLVIALFPVFGISVTFKIVNFLNTCILAYFIAVIAVHSVLKKFSMLPLVRGSFASGWH